jgi:hypothetical protein
VLLSLQLLQVLHEGLLQALEVGHRLGLGWHKAE